MKRSAELRDLSEEHHHGLVAARRLRQAVEGKAALSEAVAQFLEAWHAEIQPHFHAEEEVLLPEFARAVAPDDALIVRTLTEHVALRRAVRHLERAGDDEQQALAREIGQTLEDHIRFEERVLFPAVEAALAGGRLEELGRELSHVDEAARLTRAAPLADVEVGSKNSPDTMEPGRQPPPGGKEMKILYATDGSECAATAGRLLQALPLPAETPVTVLSATPESAWVDTPPLGAEVSTFSLFAEVRASEQAMARSAAETDAAPLRERGLAVTVSVRRQSAANAILEEAHEDGADLIVLGSHGKGAVERFLVGSVSERVARYAHCSVLVARKDTLKRAIIAVDGSESAEHALEALQRLPLPAELEMTAVYVIRPRDVMPPIELGIGPNWEAAMEQYDQQFREIGLRVARHAQERLRTAGRHLEIDVRCGAPADELVAAAQEKEADLIVVGAANRSALGRLFLGSVSGRVLSHAPCSVLVARSAVLAHQEQPAERHRSQARLLPAAG